MIFQHEFTLVVAGAFTCLQELQRKPNGRVSGPTYFFRGPIEEASSNLRSSLFSHCAIASAAHLSIYTDKTTPPDRRWGTRTILCKPF
jgi:hypothetical protein